MQIPIQNLDKTPLFLRNKVWNIENFDVLQLK